ncbi:cytochrome c family protein [Sphingopyxis indica]|uniref:c-type cytochrome n=1 Tax=Sphingopyxis indica TaxID=436663 RepID=UPI002938D62B|nr:cytochrome c family protein [Sphingopyxis indica]WOF42175.1 cytochrome c family protein [Sphingopyxis indica]
MRAAPVLLAGALIAASLGGCGKASKPDEAPAAQSAPAEPPAPAAIEPTAAMGEQIFRRCMACHTVDKGGANGIGPNLHGVVGRTVAAHPGFSYSGAMKGKGGVWDETALDAFLEDPMKTLPGTRMAFAGVIDAADREALILYLKTQSE